MNDFQRLVSLLARLKHKGWKPWALHSTFPELRRGFQAAGHDWDLVMNPTVNARTALLNLWVCPVPLPPAKIWKKLDRGPFCVALHRKLQSLRFLKVFGPSSGGRNLFYKRLTSFGQIWDNWKRIALINFASLESQRIPESPPVRGPIGPVSDPKRERLLRELVRRARSSHLSIGLTKRERAAGHQWSINFGIYWQRDPRDVRPPSTFWAAFLIWPPKGFSGEDRKALDRIGFYSRITRSLRKHKFLGRWHAYSGGYADFWRHRLRWKDVRMLCDLFQNWTVGGALAQFTDKGKPVRMEPVKYYRG